jgi:alcohol-forming fatty acyl-CoA reductase
MASIAAFFDLDGTLVPTTAIHYYFDLARQEANLLQCAWITGKLLSQIPYYFLLDQIDRRQFNHAFYRNYQGHSVSYCQQWSQHYFQQFLQHQLFPEAIACIQQHQALGHEIIVVTGSLDFVVAPLAQYLNATALATCLENHNGQFTGHIAGAPLIGEEKSQSMRAIAQSQNIDLTQSYAYSDSRTDLDMLQTVGNPTAVNPDATLNRIAQERHWSIQNWQLR